MSLPLQPPIEPQLAKSAKELPLGDGWVYEQKWDGFRVIAFVDGDEVYLQSRGSKPLDRYFPEISLPPGRYVLDGEIVILDADGRPAFGALQQRIHPAESRITRLSQETPATLLPFDLLAEGDESLLALPFADRRERLAKLLGGALSPTTATPDPAVAEEWLDTTEGVIAKELEATYKPGKRAGMWKVKRIRTIDCVVIGYREGKEPETVGSLILGAHRRRRAAGADGPLVRLLGQAEARAARPGAAVRNGRPRLRRGLPVDAGPRAGVGRPAARAGGRGVVRPRVGRPHPARREAAPVP